mmetsp:Transcript_13215/g.21690  ORF Transcript_13215/g.21690 Transcript_13215/m.21690 type:complete len:342 (+) Transcript_13215:1193-2218(+)
MVSRGAVIFHCCAFFPVFASTIIILMWSIKATTRSLTFDTRSFIGRFSLSNLPFSFTISTIVLSRSLLLVSSLANFSEIATFSSSSSETLSEMMLFSFSSTAALSEISLFSSLRFNSLSRISLFAFSCSNALLECSNASLEIRLFSSSSTAFSSSNFPTFFSSSFTLSETATSSFCSSSTCKGSSDSLLTGGDTLLSMSSDPLSLPRALSEASGSASKMGDSCGEMTATGPGTACLFKELAFGEITKLRRSVWFSYEGRLSADSCTDIFFLILSLVLSLGPSATSSAGNGEASCEGFIGTGLKMGTTRTGRGNPGFCKAFSFTVDKISVQCLSVHNSISFL